MMKLFIQRLAIPLFVFSILLGFALPAAARSDNPIELIVDGGYTLNAGVSETTQLFLDRNSQGQVVKFWVRVEFNPGTPIMFASDDTTGVDQIPLEPLPNRVSVKYFPLSRYIEVRRMYRGIQTFGLVNPYIDGAIICDAPNSTLRFWTNTVYMAYNCGAGAPNADAATFQSEALLKALRDETIANPDLQGTIPQL